MVSKRPKIVIVPEFIQDDCTAPAIAAALEHHLTNPGKFLAVLPTYSRLHEELRGQDASTSAAPSGYRPCRRSRGIAPGKL
jgi:lipid A disaccharide synthetase